MGQSRVIKIKTHYSYGDLQGYHLSGLCGDYVHMACKILHQPLQDSSINDHCIHCLKKIAQVDTHVNLCQMLFKLKNHLQLWGSAGLSPQLGNPAPYSARYRHQQPLYPMPEKIKAQVDTHVNLCHMLFRIKNHLQL